MSEYEMKKAQVLENLRNAQMQVAAEDFAGAEYWMDGATLILQAMRMEQTNETLRQENT